METADHALLIVRPASSIGIPTPLPVFRAPVLSFCIMETVNQLVLLHFSNRFLLLEVEPASLALQTAQRARIRLLNAQVVLRTTTFTITFVYLPVLQELLLTLLV